MTGMTAEPVPAWCTYRLAVYGVADTVTAKRSLTFTAPDDDSAEGARVELAATLPDYETVWLFRDGEPHPIATDDWRGFR